ncbi:hypothetical protein ACWC09_26255 [Streptomyces sp. NPDC001617]
MDAPTPQPSPHPPAVPAMAEPSPTPTPAPTTPLCTGCGLEAVVHWRRRPTDSELTELVAAEQSRRDEMLLLADPQLPPPAFPPLPATDNTTITVYACAAHAITLDAATHTHQGTCTAPNEAHLPGCDCTPEPHPHAPREAPSRLPAHWTT